MQDIYQDIGGHGPESAGSRATEVSAIWFDAIGTQWRIDLQAPDTVALRSAILDRIARFDAVYSRFRTDSLVARIATAPHGGSFEFPEDAEKLFDLYDRLAEASEGAVDPLVGADLERLGYDRTYSFKPAAAKPEAKRPSWRADIRRSATTLTTTSPVVIDIGAAGKGYLVDIVAELLLDAGMNKFIIDAGSDLRVAGSETLAVGLEHPLDPSLAIGIASVRQSALCASATNRRTWGPGLHHVIDGRTGKPASGIIATWAVAATAAVADGMATALFFTPPQELQQNFDFAAVRMFANGQVDVTDNFEGELFS